MKEYINKRCVIMLIVTGLFLLVSCNRREVKWEDYEPGLKDWIDTLTLEGDCVGLGMLFFDSEGAILVRISQRMELLGCYR